MGRGVVRQENPGGLPHAGGLTMPGVTTYDDADRARLAILSPKGTRWLGPREVARCEHGRFYGYRWNAPRDFDVDDRPTRASFESGDVEALGGSCRKCHPEDDDE